jgi:hypothetical protein
MTVSVWQAVRANTNLGEARRAEREKTEQLAHAYFTEAQAKHWSGRAGRRFESLELLKKAAELYRGLGQFDEQRALELRNEAIACLALADLKAGKEWTPEPGWSKHLGFDPALRYYAVRPASDDDPTRAERHQGDLSIRRVADDQEVAHLPGFGFRAGSTQFSLDGRYLAVHYGDPGRPLHDYIWDLERREPILKLAQGSHDTSPSFSPDGQLVAFTRPDYSIRIYEQRPGQKLDQ